MKNIISTVPKGNFDGWADAERVLRMCDGEDHADRKAWFWPVNCANMPLHSGVGAVCFLIYDGEVRGYMDIVDAGEVSRRGRKGTARMLLANWHPIPAGHYQRGFQGYRYTELWP